MIDAKKWAEADDKLKMDTIKIIMKVMADATVTKADNRLITEFLINKCGAAEDTAPKDSTSGDSPESEEV